jgi:autophagy-related protein 17
MHLVFQANTIDQSKATVESLDSASARLNRTLLSLRSTLVEPSFRPPTDAQKYLFDFVDEAGISELEDSIKASIDRFDTARSTFAETCEAFESDLGRLHESLQAPVEEDGHEKLHDIDGDTPIPGLFYALESHATETATSLQGLVKHYDLCVTALKHTEGGGEAINQAASTAEDHDQEASALAGLGVDLGRLDATPPIPMSEEERTEMLVVLFKDAAEVEEVVGEIKDQLAEMEDQLAQVETYLQTLRDTSKRLINGLGLLKHVASNVPSYITACAVFQGAWEDEKAVLGERMQGLEGLREFYSGFANAYDGLLVEVHRRKHVKRDTEKVIRKAMEELEKLYQGLSFLVLMRRVY